MKSTGIIRKIDELGRIVLPMELRKKFDIQFKDSIEIFVSNNKIILSKYEEEDIFTGEKNSDLIEYNGKKVSISSIEELAKLAGFEITKKVSN